MKGDFHRRRRIFLFETTLNLQKYSKRRVKLNPIFYQKSIFNENAFSNPDSVKKGKIVNPNGSSN